MGKSLSKLVWIWTKGRDREPWVIKFRLCYMIVNHINQSNTYVMPAPNTLPPIMTSPAAACGKNMMRLMNSTTMSMYGPGGSHNNYQHHNHIRKQSFGGGGI